MEVLDDEDQGQAPIYEYDLGRMIKWILAKNPGTKLQRSDIRFWPYSTEETFPVIDALVV